METAHDSIKYIMPVYTKDAGIAGEYALGGGANDMDPKYDGAFGEDGLGDVMYESTESRYATEMAEAEASTDSTNDIKINCNGHAFGASGVNLIDGYTEIYYNDEILAMQVGADHGAAKWMINPGVKLDVALEGTPAIEGPVDGVYTVHLASAASGETTKYKAIARYNSETDLMGNYLGEVELTMKDYHFRPRPITLGVTWTQLTELVLDTSFGLSAEEMLMDSAAQEIKKTLDYQAIKYASHVQKVAGNKVVEFDAEPPAADAVTTKDSYWHTAQLIQQAIDKVGDVQLDKIGRGGVTSIVGGPAAVNYLKLNKGWSDRGRQPKIGAHKIGELDGISVFKVPSTIIPNDELLTVWKNEANDSDVAVAIGTLLPFYSTGAIQRKNLYKEAAIARFEDTKALQKDYLGRIKIKGLRQAN